MGALFNRGAVHVALYPSLMLPVCIAVLAFNFFGDGLRDAADPYK